MPQNGRFVRRHVPWAEPPVPCVSVAAVATKLHKRESSGFFSKKILPKPKKGPNLFFEVEIVSLA